MTRRGVLIAVTAVLAGWSAAPGSPAGAAPAPSVSLATATRSVQALTVEVTPLKRSAERSADWLRCLTEVRARENGDPDGQFGYRYDYQDGTSHGYRTALALDPTGPVDAGSYTFFDLGGAQDCVSAAPQPGGTAEAAGVRGGSTPAARLARLEGRVQRIATALRRIAGAAKQFDLWESCVAEIPVSEYGDPRRAYGYLFGAPGQPFAHRPALAIDRSGRDDPDYLLLAFVGRTRPGPACDTDPGESADDRRPVVAPATTAAAGTAGLTPRLARLERRIAALHEDTDDLVAPVGEFELFDQCAFALGVRSAGTSAAGFAYGTGRRSALSLDLGDATPAALQLLAFPAEEPPSIECNEDAMPSKSDDDDRRRSAQAARTSNSVSVTGPKEVTSATSTASRPRPTTTRPTRRRLLRASNVYQPPSR